MQMYKSTNPSPSSQRIHDGEVENAGARGDVLEPFAPFAVLPFA